MNVWYRNSRTNEDVAVKKVYEGQTVKEDVRGRWVLKSEHGQVKNLS